MALRTLTLAGMVAGLLLSSAAAEAKPATVKVMTRNLYLGADLTPGYEAKDFQGLVNAAGTIYNDVGANDFRKRARGLAREILANKPDLVGLQEVALWREQPCDQNPLPPSATKVRYDYLKLLLAKLNKRTRGLYRAAVVKPEFDFEVWANTDGDEATSGPSCPMGSEVNGRLTMRDAILVRRGAARVSNPSSGTFDTLLQVKPGGFAVDVTRGWTALDVKIRGKRFHFANAHFEAFDNSASNSSNKGTDVGNGEIREAQAKEFVGSGGPAGGKGTTIIVGDFNSDVRTEVKPGDGLAYRALLAAGFERRARNTPNTCCLDVGLLKATEGGRRSDFDHTVDHVMTNSKRVKLVRSRVTGLSPFRGYWDSDHAGLVSTLRIR